jgi:hypothetical protein
MNATTPAASGLKAKAQEPLAVVVSAACSP